MMRILALLLIIILSRFNTLGQLDSTWNLLIVKKGKQIELKDDMAKYSRSGFYLHRNCLYDVILLNEAMHTLKLIGIRPDSLTFIPKANNTVRDTLVIHYKEIDKILLVKNWLSNSRKEIKCAKYNFVFHKSPVNYTFPSKYDYIFSADEKMSELHPRLTHQGITYFYEYQGKLYFHSSIEVQQPNISNKEKANALKAAAIALDLLINRRITVTIRREKR